MNKKLIQLNDLTFEPYISEQEIQERIRILGMMINENYQNTTNLTIVVLLKGAFVFAADLLREINVPHTLHFVTCSSYEGTESTGQVKIQIHDKLEIKNNRILIVEDIIDTGKTLLDFVAVLNEHEPLDISIVTLLNKMKATDFPYPVEYCGFKIDDDFVVGYGMDYNEQGRNLRDVYILHQEGDEEE